MSDSSIFDNVLRMDLKDLSLLQEKEIMARVSSGDEQALLFLYNNFSSPVFNYLLRILNDQPAAEDVLQETFIAVWKGANHFQGKSKIKTWVFKIAHHQAVNWLRKKKNGITLDAIDKKRWQESTESTALQNSESRELVSALSKLSRKHRAVIELAFVQELSYAEIAEVLSCPVGTVKSRVSFALKYLGVFLAQDSGKD